MAKKIKKKKTSSARKRLNLKLTKQQKILFGSFLILFGTALLLSFISYLFSWQADQSQYGDLSRSAETQNWLSKFGANAGNFFIYKGFGIASFIIAFLIILSGIYYFMNYERKNLLKNWIWGLVLIIWL